VDIMSGAINEAQGSRKHVGLGEMYISEGHLSTLRHKAPIRTEQSCL
jgi:hypothetical protein